MNTSKQVNVMIGLLFLAFVGFAAYIVYENPRADAARETQTDTHARRGAELYVLNCANCHGVRGEGYIGFPLALDAFLIIGEDDPRGWEETPLGEADEIHEFLFNTIACGRRGTSMPLWLERYGGPLSETQVNYIVTMITEGRWDLVESEWEAYAREQGYEPDEYEDEFLIQDPGVLAITSGNCGQYTAVERQDFINRDPSGVEPAPTPDPDETPDPDAPPEDRMVQGIPVGDFFQASCASCHGANREGTAIAPGLTPGDLTQDRQTYFETIRDGVPGTAMPSWEDQGLTEADIEALTDYVMEVEP